MPLNLSKSFSSVSSGQTISSVVYNTDITALFNAFSGLEAQTSTLGGLTITPSANSTTTLNVTNASGTSIFSVDTSGSNIAMSSKGLFLIFDKVYSSAATSEVITVAGNTDIIYEVIATFKNGVNATTKYNLRFNADTGANYGWWNMYTASGTNYAGGSAGDTKIELCENQSASTHVAMWRGTIYAKQATGLYRTLVGTGINDTTGTSPGSVNTVGGSWSNTADAITSLTFVASQTNGIGIGSHIQIFARR